MYLLFLPKLVALFFPCRGVCGVKWEKKIKLSSLSLSHPVTNRSKRLKQNNSTALMDTFAGERGEKVPIEILACFH